MYLKYFYDADLAHASYLVGCQRSGEALVIDPGRAVDRYIQAAQNEGLRIVAAAETHIHADFVSGSRELADRLGATLYLSDEGPADWKYEFASQYNHRLLKDDDVFHIGGVELLVMHTPGHTPESLSFILTDRGGGADAPMGIFTGDFVFVGAVGRPDLLETAAGVIGSAEMGARQLYRSIERFRTLPDHLQVWPAHGAGSACGRGLGAIPSSTVGYEKLFNPGLQFHNEQAFVNDILTDQPETPRYFAVMKRVNKTGPRLVRELPGVKEQPVEDLELWARDAMVIDTAASARFAKGFVAGTINIPTGMLARWAGYLVDYERPIYLISDRDSLTKQLDSLRSIGIDQVAGFFDEMKVSGSGLRRSYYVDASPTQLASRIQAGQVSLVDVRAETEYRQAHIAQSHHHFLGDLIHIPPELNPDQPIVTQCQSGGRSAIAASILARQGYKVLNMSGGLNAWLERGLPVETASQPSATPVAHSR